MTEDPLGALEEGRSQPTPSFLRDVTVPAWVLADLTFAANISRGREGAQDAIQEARRVLNASQSKEDS